jgi:release factor glutamine methyltransferase
LLWQVVLAATGARSIADVVSRATVEMAEAGIDKPALDAEVMAAAAVGISREKLLTLVGEMPPTATHIFADFVFRRMTREPVAYIIGHKEFFSLEFEINSSVLIPRPDSEVLAAAALEWVHHRGGHCRVLDLCTGCGAIAIAIAVNCSTAQIVATDISQAALMVAQRNADRLQVANRIRFQCCDLWPGPEREEDRFDLIVANPPYIGAAEMARLAPEVIRFEPRLALDGGVDGLRFYRSIAQRARNFLKTECRLMVEIGAGQRAAVVDILVHHGAIDLVTISDLAGIDRVVSARFVSERRSNR